MSSSDALFMYTILGNSRIFYFWVLFENFLLILRYLNDHKIVLSSIIDLKLKYKVFPHKIFFVRKKSCSTQIPVRFTILFIRVRHVVSGMKQSFYDYLFFYYKI